MFLFELAERIIFWKNADRIGPDMPYTHWRLYVKSTMRRLCKEKFKHFGDGAEIRPGAHIICCSKISLGRRVVVRPGSVFEADPRRGGQGITIENDVVIGPGVNIYVNNHTYKYRLPIIDQGWDESKAVIIKTGAWIGANVIILPGITIGTNTVVGAGSVVTRNIPDRAIAVGNPARVIKVLSDKHRKNI